jgi:hypothetical protein
LVFEHLRDLRVLSRIPKLSSSQLDEAVKLMRGLREVGFTNREIEVLVGGRWREATIKRHTRGVKTVRAHEKDRVLKLFSDCVERGYDIEELENFFHLKNILESKNYSYQILVNMMDKLLKLNTNVGEFNSLLNEIDVHNLSIEEIRNTVLTLEELKKYGIKFEEISKLLFVAAKYGGFKKILEALDLYDGLIQITKIMMDTKDEVRKLSGKIQLMESQENLMKAKMETFKAYFSIVKKLVNEYNFDIDSLTMIISLAEKHGDALKIIALLTKYNSLKDLENEVAEESEKLEMINVQMEEKRPKLAMLESFIGEANFKIGKIEAEYEKSLRLQNIVDMIEKPQELEMTPDGFNRLSLVLLRGMVEFAKHNHSSMEPWIKNAKYFVESAANVITRMLMS